MQRSHSTHMASSSSWEGPHKHVRHLPQGVFKDVHVIVCVIVNDQELVGIVTAAGTPLPVKTVLPIMGRR